MADQKYGVNSTIAPISNVARFTGLVDKVVNRPGHLPGFGVFCGRSGLGKTFSSIYAINAYRAHHVEIGWSWTPKALCQAIIKEIGAGMPERTVYDMVTQIAHHLADNPERPLILDEADHLVRRKCIEVVREIYNGCADAGASIILIGEENLPAKLKEWERVHSRVLEFVRALPVDTADVKHLAKLYCPGVKIADDLIETTRKQTRGSARRVVVNLHNYLEVAREEGWKTVDLDKWNGRGFDTGEAAPVGSN